MAIYGTLGENNLTALSASISDTAVDIFIYDTSKDSDGGAWRKRTQHTSWYNETLNTATRGSRREFPAVAVIVTEDAKVTIYDGDDPDLPMWMVFNAASFNWLFYTSGGKSSVMLNGKLANAAGGSNQRFRTIDFVSDSHREYAHTDGQASFSGGIDQRNSGSATLSYSGTGGLIDRNCNDVAMTVLPNAPIDSATGLPVPTIAVATEGGLSIIKANGTVIDYVPTTAAWHPLYVDVYKTDRFIMSLDGTAGGFIVPVESGDVSFHIATNPPSNWVQFRKDGSGNDIQTLYNQDTFVNELSVASDGGLNFLDVNESSYGNSLVAYATTSYNTGWMHGDIKGAFLSDTDATNVTGTELVTNGTFDSDVSGWTTGTSTITYNSGAANIARNNSGAAANQIYQNISGLTIGQKYLISIKITALSNFVSVYFDPDGSDPLVEPIIATATGTYTAIYTATQTSGALSINATGNTTATATVDDISMRVAELDRSVNNKGLQVFGTVTKSPVAGSGATAAELVAYGGFSTSNYLLQPYNSDFEIGTGDFTHMLWYKGTGSAPNGSVGAREVFTRTAGTTNHWLLYKEYTNYIGFDSIYSPNTVQADVWYHVAVVRKSRVVYLYENGVLVNSAANSKNIADTSGGFMVGQDPANNDWRTRGYLSLVRFSTSTASSEQIKKIYEDEKVLFQENAACTLYGSSDAVTALAYDEKTELLHVGTSSGRSDFNGLRRINNTTSAVTTAISAYDGSIAQQ